MGGRSLPPQFWSASHLHGGYRRQPTCGRAPHSTSGTAPHPPPLSPLRHTAHTTHTHRPPTLHSRTNPEPNPEPNPNQAASHVGMRELERDSARRDYSWHRRPALPVRRRSPSRPPFPRTHTHATHGHTCPPPSRAMKTHNLVIFRTRYSGLGRSHFSVEMQFNRACHPYSPPLHRTPPRPPPVPHVGRRLSGDEDTSPAESALLS